MSRPIYLDHHATTPLDLRVLEAMQPWLEEGFGNAASVTHSYGWEAAGAVHLARRQVAGLIGAAPREIVFTSGATESDNLAILGVADALAAKGRHLITCASEHHAVLDTCRHLESHGYQVTCLPVDSTGLVSLDDLETAMRPDTILVSIMTANNEIGTLQPIGAIGALTRSRGVLFHTDAAQALSLLHIDVDEAGVDLMSISAHKMYGPKGIGALYVRSGTPISPQIHGGGHEGGLRSGTLNVPGIVGFGAAAVLAGQQGPTDAARLRSLRDRLHQLIAAALPDVKLNGHRDQRLASNLNLSFPSVDAQTLLNRLHSVIAASTGSACTSAAPEPSHVLRAIGTPYDLSAGSVRFGLGRTTTEADINIAADAVIREVQFLVSPTTDSTETRP